MAVHIGEDCCVTTKILDGAMIRIGRVPTAVTAAGASNRAMPNKRYAAIVSSHAVSIPGYNPKGVVHLTAS
ncbi:MAG: hypothetical protein NC930_09265 [Candidatus Omnitrophica bacterium]|nr:hypothetical protein [Candidatus Omnitrophota bacterium]